MKNVDVPLWDKGDDTDDFSKGGASNTPSFNTSSTFCKKSGLIEKIYKQILGRKPSSREMAYYKYSSSEKEEIMERLLKSDEHKEILDKSQKYPELKEKNKELESTILKLKSRSKDRVVEYTELKRLLEEKNQAIQELRQEKNFPYLTEEKILNQTNVHYNASRVGHKYEQKDEKFWDRLSYLLFGNRN